MMVSKLFFILIISTTGGGMGSFTHSIGEDLSTTGVLGIPYSYADYANAYLLTTSGSWNGHNYNVFSTGFVSSYKGLYKIYSFSFAQRAFSNRYYVSMGFVRKVYGRILLTDENANILDSISVRRDVLGVGLVVSVMKYTLFDIYRSTLVSVNFRHVSSLKGKGSVFLAPENSIDISAGYVVGKEGYARPRFAINAGLRDFLRKSDGKLRVFDKAGTRYFISFFTKAFEQKLGFHRHRFFLSGNISLQNASGIEFGIGGIAEFFGKLALSLSYKNNSSFKAGIHYLPEKRDRIGLDFYVRKNPYASVPLYIVNLSYVLDKKFSW